jgi:hypothetical protein
MDRALDDLQLDETRSILCFSDDVLALIVRAAYSFRTLKALANTCSRLCVLARGSAPVQLWVQHAFDARMLLELVASKRPDFSGCCSDLVVEAKDLDACFELPAVLTVAAELTNLRALDLIVSPTTAAEDVAMSPGGMDEADCDMAGLLSPLSELQQLQQLTLEVPVLGNVGVALLGGLQQLTSLQLTQARGYGLSFTPPDLSPLSSMGHLVELIVDMDYGPQAPAAADGPWALPSSLQRLHLPSEVAPWLRHLPGCPQLTELQYRDHDHQSDVERPAAVLELAARHTPGLRLLTCLYEWDEEPIEQLFPNGADLPVPAAALAALTAIEELHAGCCLSVSDAGEWRALGHLTALTALMGIMVYRPPPELWQHTGVKQLALALALHGVGGAGTLQVLQAFSAVQHAHLYVTGLPEAAGAEAAGQEPAGGTAVPPALSSLTSLRLDYSDDYFDFGSSITPAGHVVPILAAASSVAELTFKGWQPGRGNHVPLDLSVCSALTRLVLEGMADAGHVVAVVQPLAPTLRVLGLEGMWQTITPQEASVLQLNCMDCITPQAAIVLQDVLPHLEEIYFIMCGRMSLQDPSAGSEQEQLARLRQQLRPGLTLRV